MRARDATAEGAAGRPPFSEMNEGGRENRLVYGEKFSYRSCIFFLAGITRAPGSFGKRTPREVFLKDAPTGRQKWLKAVL